MESKLRVSRMLARSVAALAEEEKTKLNTSAPVIGTNILCLNSAFELLGQFLRRFTPE